MKALLAAGAIVLLGLPPALAQQSQIAPGPSIAGAQVPLPWQGEPGGQAIPQGPAATAMYAARSANIRAGAGTAYSVIGKLHVGDGVQVLGSAPGNPGWDQLATGGFVSAATLSPVPVVVVAHPHHRYHQPVDVPAPSGAYYPVGACEPYSKVVDIGGQPSQINGTACKQPDGTWRISNYGVPTPVLAAPPQAPVLVAPAPVYAAPPPEVIIEHEHHHDQYWRDRDRGY